MWERPLLYSAPGVPAITPFSLPLNDWFAACLHATALLLLLAWIQSTFSLGSCRGQSVFFTPNLAPSLSLALLRRFR